MTVKIMGTTVRTGTDLSRPKMKALSLMLWLVSSEYWLTFENRLWRTRVDGPDGDKHTKINLTSYRKHVLHEILLETVLLNLGL